MSNEEEIHFIPHLRTFQMENIPRLKISVFNDKSKLEINRIFMPIDSNILPENEIDSSEDNQRMKSDQTKFFQQSIIDSIDHQQDYNHEEQSIVPIDTINKSPLSSSNGTNKTDNLSRNTQIEQSLTPPFAQMIPDSIINDKQTTKRIYNEITSTHFTHLSKFITLTSMKSLQKKPFKSIDKDLSSSNYVRYYPIGSLVTSTSPFLMHQNRVIAHATASNSFLSDTIFIILIATLTIIILLFCLGLFCLCRRTTKRNISPSFDGGSYTGLNRRSFGIPIDNHQQQNSKYENNIPTITNLPLMNQPRSINDQIPLSSTVALHHTARQRVQINNKKLKKKRVGFCCCNSKRTPSTTVNARTRM